MRLLRIQLHNFKGIRAFDLDTQGGQNVAIYGDNGTGKTTLMDAFTWLLWGKDSQNRADFEILPLTKEGKRHKNITEASVQIDLDIPSETDVIVLRRTYAEKWQARRGSRESEMTGHTTTYSINGVPVKEREWKNYIQNLVKDENVFRLLSNPRFFSDFLSWQDRRKLLVDMCGDVPDDVILDADPKLAHLPAILGKLTHDQYRSRAAEQRRLVNAKLDELPARIDEAERAMPSAEQDAKGIKATLARLRKTRETKLQMKADIASGGGVVEKRNELHEIELSIRKLEDAHKATVADGVNRLKQQMRSAQTELADAKARQATLLTNRQRLNGDIERQQKQLDEKAKDWRKLSAETFEDIAPTICPMCQQPLPPEQIEVKQQMLQANWNTIKAQGLEKIKAEGTSLKQAVDEMMKRLDKVVAECNEIDEAITRLQKAAEDFQTQVWQQQSQPSELATDEYLKLKRQQHTLDGWLALAEGQTDTSQIDAEVAVLDASIAEQERLLGQSEQYDRAEARIKELKAEQSELAVQLSDWDNGLFLLDLYTKHKVTMLTDRINSRFTMAQFRLFRELINGGIEECCDVTHLGVPWDSGLNNGSQVAVGLDIINRLADFYETTVPVWIDNRESALHLPTTASQIISLYVSGADPILRVEVEP